MQDKRAINFNASANSYDPRSSDSDMLCHGAYCHKPAACVSILDDTDAINACAAVDVSMDDTKIAMENCESAGAPGTAIYQPGVGVHEHAGDEHASVCRYQPDSMDICPYTVGDGEAYVPNACVPAATAQECSAAVLGGTSAEDIAACETAIPGCEISAGACVPKTSACATADLSGTDAEDSARCALIPGCRLEMVAHDGDCACPADTTKVIPGSAADQPPVDECQQSVYGGEPADACSAPEHRLCGQDDGDLDGEGDHGLPGRHCTDFRRSFFCPDHATENTCQPLATAEECDGVDSTTCRTIVGCKVFDGACVPRTSECAAAVLDGSDEQDAINCEAIDGCQLVRGADDGFTCVDYNNFWFGDAMCSCAYSNGLCESPCCF